MNKDRRKRIADLVAKLNEIKETLDEVLSEEQEYFDNMPESFQSGEKGEKAEEAIDNLTESAQQLDESISALEAAQG